MSVVITGLGAVTPLGGNVAENWRALIEGRTAISPITRFDLKGLACGVAGQVDPAMPGDAVRYAVTAAREAICQSGADVGRLGMITGSNFGAHDSECDGHAALRVGVASAIRPGGPVASLSLSCSSGASAVAVAACWISEGLADAVLVIGVDAISLCSWSGLCSLRTMARCGEVRPFSADRGGTVFSEGAGALLLESGESCLARGGRPLAVLSGWATGNNGFHLTAPPPRAAGSFRVMRDAVAASGMSPSSIGFVMAHATATHANDLTEAQALHDLFGERAADVPVAALKSASGHLLGAAGSFEAAMTVMALCEGVVPPLAHVPSPDSEIPRLDVVTDCPRHVEARHALTDSAGFGGCNAALVVSSADSSAKEDPVEPGGKRGVAILSSGFISALGIGSEEAAAAWAEGESACFPPTRVQPPEGVADCEAGEVPDFDPDSLLPTAKAYLDRQGLLAMSAGALALQGASLTDKERFGISHGTGFGASETLDRFNHDCLEKGPRLVKPMLFPHTYANAASSLISMEWELRGYHANFAGGVNASSFAICSAVAALRRGECDAVLAGGSEALSAARWAAEARIAGSFSPGEGAALFRLVREGDPAADSPLALISGIGMAGDVTAAVSGALADAGIKPGEVRRIFVSSREIVRAIADAQIFSVQERDIVVPEEMTGFCGGASGAVQLACALLEPIDGNILIITSDAADGSSVAMVITSSGLDVPRNI